MSESVRHFLVVRRFGKLESIRAFDEIHEAMDAYEQQEREIGWLPTKEPPLADCVLLGADRLASCIATHGNWFDEPLDLAFGMAVAETLPEWSEADGNSRQERRT